MSTVKNIITYYNESWLPRFKNGHNSSSLAMHMGYFENQDVPNDQAKVEMNKFLSAQFPIESGKKQIIVDAGCGVGGTCKFLSENFEDLTIIGVNIHSEQIQFAKSNITNPKKNTSVEFLNEDYANTSINSESVDFLFAMESMCHAPDKPKLYSEVFRILKRGGVCLFFDYFITQQDVNLLSEEHKSLLNNFADGWAVTSYPFITADDTMRNIGFSSVKSVSLTDKVLPGINHSFNKATQILEKEANHTSVFAKHLNANIALKQLIDLKLIDYRMIKAIK